MTKKLFLDKSLDAGGHINDIYTWYKKVKLGGTLCGHDFHIQEVQRLTKMILNDLGYKYQDNGKSYSVSKNEIWYLTKDL